MKQYICTGECGGVSDKPGVCEAEDCSMHGEPLVEREAEEEDETEAKSSE